MQYRSYLPGRLWISTNQPDMIRKALYACNIIGRPHHISANDGPSRELDILKWRPEALPKAGQWVRATRGLYKGDLAFVLKNTSFNDVLQIAVVPRVLFGSPLTYETQHAGKKRKLSSRSSRPAPLLFDPEAAKTQSFMEEQQKVAAALNSEQMRSKAAPTQCAVKNQVDIATLLDAIKKVVQPTPDLGPQAPYTLPNGTLRNPHEIEIPQDTCYLYKGATYIGGLLVKNVRGSDFRFEELPMKHEMASFVHSRIWPAIILPQFVAMHWKSGDKIFFYAGLRNIPGSIASIESHTANVRPDFNGLGNVNVSGETIPIKLTDLYRRWTVGDGVKVVAGPDLGKEGLIVQVYEDPPGVDFLEKDSMTPVRLLCDQ